MSTKLQSLLLIAGIIAMVVFSLATSAAPAVAVPGAVEIPAVATGGATSLFASG